jgi:hypothetical protein
MTTPTDDVSEYMPVNLNGSKPPAYDAEPLQASEPSKPSAPLEADVQLANAPVFHEPDPLIEEMEPPAPYPVDALGPLLGGAVKSIAKIVQVPPAMAAQSILAAASLAVQGLADVYRSGNKIPLSLFCLTVAESGDRKSAADKLALHEHEEFQKRELINYYKAMTTFTNDDAVYEKQRKQILNGKNKVGHSSDNEQLQALEDKRGSEPRHPLIFAQDATYEGLQKSLLQGVRSQGLLSNEGGQFFGGYSVRVENVLGTIAGLSKVWDGDVVSRTRASTNVPEIRYGCRLTVHFMIQPVVALQVLSNVLMQGQGFLPRFLVVWTPTLAGERLYQDFNPYENEHLQAFWQCMRGLLKPEVTTKEDEEPQRQKLELDDSAMAFWISEHDTIEVQLGRLGDMHDIKPMASKAAEMMLRIAGILAMVEQETVISVDLVKRAAEIMHWYLDEALRLVSPVKENPELVQAQRLLDWLVTKNWSEFDREKLCKSGPGWLRRTTKLRNDLLGELIARHWLLTEDNKTFKPHSLAFEKVAKTEAAKPTHPLNGDADSVFGGDI